MDTSLTIVQGDAKDYSLTFTKAGSALDLTGATITMTVKRSLKDTTAVLVKTITEHTDPTAGKTVVSLTGTDTNLAVGAYYYDMQLTSSALGSRTVVKGRLHIDWQVSNG